MRYINQLEYRHIPYRTNVLNPEYTEEMRQRNVALSGCGPCSVCMMVDYLTDQSLDIADCIKISEEHVANHHVGTDMAILAPVISEKFNLDYHGTSDLSEAVAHLQKGGAIIAHVGVREGESIGLFTKGGHYVFIVSTDGERFCILDPSYTPEKFTLPERVGKVNTAHAPYLYCDINIFQAELKEGKIGYHLFSRKCE